MVLDTQTTPSMVPKTNRNMIGAFNVLKAFCIVLYMPINNSRKLPLMPGMTIAMLAKKAAPKSSAADCRVSSVIGRLFSGSGIRPMPMTMTRPSRAKAK